MGGGLRRHEREGAVDGGRESERARERESERASARERQRDGAREDAAERDLVSQKVFTRSFCKSQFPHRSVNLSFILVVIRKMSRICAGIGFSRTPL